jgi:hypothetical protein
MVTMWVLVDASLTMSQSQMENGFKERLGEGASQDLIKVMLATDNHIGYLERDPVRGQDAINTFEEILQLAVKHDVRCQYRLASRLTWSGRFHSVSRGLVP